ncbi:hypothetical protein Pan153_02180 [Gimesia panareensis]|uniref:Uncharacterized protein n=1 Tax=Gimesia panareensis TaxID=2527978 RepID=A0A518FGZ3_9PLAN|nr:hypothetical protein [Gimesia panareensis]QDV15602.1 hypothetical protein Pan153_02180 [Gimesia panareensis]
MDYEYIDRALGRTGAPPQSLETGFSPAERDELLAEALCFPERALPTGELADWAFVLMDLGKQPAVMAAVSVIETVLNETPPERADVEFANQVLAELHIWLESPQTVDDLRRLGDLWWSLTRNPPHAAHTPLGDAAFMAWYLAGYDPEGWDNPPGGPEQLRDWLAEAADNVGAVVDVFSLVQQAVGPERHWLLINSVRSAVGCWRDMDSTMR